MNIFWGQGECEWLLIIEVVRAMQSSLSECRFNQNLICSKIKFECLFSLDFLWPIGPPL